MGTDNSALLEDPYYIGYRGRRLRGAEYDAFVEEFVQAVRHVFPRALLQWEDFKKANAFRLLERYAGRLPSFNDDIQGTSAVTLAGILSGLRLTGQPLREQRFLLAGSGAAGVGIGRLLRAALLAEGLTRGGGAPAAGVRGLGRRGLRRRGRSWSAQARGRLASARTWRRSAWPTRRRRRSKRSLRPCGPTVLIGTTGQPGDFTPAVIRAMADRLRAAAHFPAEQSRPAKPNAHPPRRLLHSEGRALVATGSPFEPVVFKGQKHVIGQCNNVFVFPGVGLGVLHQRSQPRHRLDVPGGGAARWRSSPARTDAEPGCLYPSLRGPAARSASSSLSRSPRPPATKGLGRSAG